MFMTGGTPRAKTGSQHSLPVFAGLDHALNMRHGSPPLNEFDPIAEGVTELEAVVTGERNALDDFDSKCGELGFPLFQVADFGRSSGA
jgi:hypothetical protein